MTSSSDLVLYTASTMNGWKPLIFLEEAELDCELVHIDFSKQEQKEDWYVALNPNGRIPTLVDRSQDDFAVFESGAILWYLAEKYGRFLPEGPLQRSQALQWLMFQMGGVGPMMGQANVFHRYLDEKIPVAIHRYQNEVRRLFTVLDGHLSHNEYLVNDYSIADMANWCWVRTYEWSGVSIEGLANLQRWKNSIEDRPAARRGVAVPNKIDKEDLLKGAKSVVTR